MTKLEYFKQQSPQYYDEEELMVPPWITYSDFEGIAWRMGEGEYYSDMFEVYYNLLNKENKTKILKKYPIPNKHKLQFDYKIPRKVRKLK